MKSKNNRVLLSAVVVALLTTGCVKPTDKPNTTNTPNTVGNSDPAVYPDQPATVVYEDATPIVYEDPATSSSSGTIYGTDSTIITTNSYEPIGGTTTPSSPSSSGGLYGDPYGGAGGTYSESSTGGEEIYTDPYATSGGGAATTAPSYGGTPSYGGSSGGYTTETSYGGASSGNSNAPGIHLQIAALKEYFAAVAFKDNLSLDPKYSAYVKKGRMNKVIVTGIPNRAEAKRLATRQFPGAFIVGGSPISGGSSYGGGSYSSYPSAPAPTRTPSYSGNRNGIGIQIGAFSSQAKARDVAESSAGSRYRPMVKKVMVRGKTLYKAIVVGFTSRAEAKNAISSGQFNGFVVSGIR